MALPDGAGTACYVTVDNGETCIASPVTDGETILGNFVGGRSYKIGELYDDGSKKGIVFQISQDGLHGKILSLGKGECRFYTAFAWCEALGYGRYLPDTAELHDHSQIFSFC